MPLYWGSQKVCPVIQTGFYAVLTVTTNEGATVELNGQTETATTGVVTFNIYTPGTYTVVCSKNGNTKSGTITISDATNYSLQIFPESNVPDAYQELEYIQSNSTGYIDTGFQFTSNNAKISLDVMLTAQDSGGKNLFGSSTNNDTSWFGIYMQGAVQGGFYCGNSNPFSFYFTRNVKKSLYFYRNNYSLEFSNDGEISTYTVGGTIICGNNVMIASQPPLGASRTPPGVRYYNFTIEQDGAIERQFVPCYRKSDTVVGMYDVRYQNFYPPAAGTFDAGGSV